jgi:hypothetical protein
MLHPFQKLARSLLTSPSRKEDSMVNLDEARLRLFGFGKPEGFVAFKPSSQVHGGLIRQVISISGGSRCSEDVPPIHGNCLMRNIMIHHDIEYSSFTKGRRL